MKIFVFCNFWKIERETSGSEKDCKTLFNVDFLSKIFKELLNINSKKVKDSTFNGEIPTHTSHHRRYWHRKYGITIQVIVVSLFVVVVV